jgi:CBS domain-containing membrane protein
MEERDDVCNVTEGDLRAALKDIRTYVDVTEEDLKKIFEIAVRHSAERRRPKITVRRTMTMEVVSVKPGTDIHVAADLLTRHRISGMPVVDDEDRVIGVIGEADILALAGLKREHGFKDILRHMLGEPVPARKKTGDTVGEVMSSPPITARPDDDIKDVATILDERRIKRLPVVDEEGKLIGVISRADIIRIMGRDAHAVHKKRK